MNKMLLVFGYVRREYCTEDNMEFPADLTQLFSKWFLLIDHFDKNKLHQTLRLETDTKITKKATQMIYASAFGTFLVSKGQKHCWTLHLSNSFALIGIIANDIIESKKEICDFSDSEHEGYALSLGLLNKYHASDSRSDGIFEYAQYFNIKFSSEPIIVSMELDLTQRRSDKGLLSYTFHMEQCKELENVSNIAYDDIDVDKSYRAGFCLTDDMLTIEFIDKIDESK